MIDVLPNGLFILAQLELVHYTFSVPKKATPFGIAFTFYTSVISSTVLVVKYAPATDANFKFGSSSFKTSTLLSMT